MGARSSFTIFGSYICPTGYHSDYTGYMFAHYYGGSSQHKGEFICIDQDPQSYGQRGSSGDDQALLYAVEVQSCSLLSCPPYVINRELACAQCSKPAIASKIPRDCAVSQWSAWSVCDKPCNIGQHLRQRSVMHLSENGGRACPPLNETTTCNVQACSDSIISNSTYIHWGRSDCPHPSTVLYTGVVTS